MTTEERYSMFEKEIARYNDLLAEYKTAVINKFDIRDLKEYNEILFSAHSCAIEGNSFSVDDTRALKEQGLGMIPVGKTLFEAFEILDHFKAYEFLMERTEQPLTEQLIKETHRILTEHTLTYRYKDAVPGEYTNTDMGPKLIEATQKAIEDVPVHPIEISAQFHRHFIFLHPFRDGNGRLGRLLSNFILMKLNHPIIIINKEDRETYINALKCCRDEYSTVPIVGFFFHIAIKKMEKEIALKKQMNKDHDFEYSV